MTKETIFISHVAPSDNYFATWLSSKLKILGYKVWVELDELKIGDAFWPQIESAIRTNTLRFISVISKEYCDKVRISSSGVFKEISCADRIKEIPNFLCPIRIDETEPDDFPVQLMGIQSISFFNNWQDGLNELVKNFSDQNVPKQVNENQDALSFWLDSFNIKGILNDIPEKIYSNWFDFDLPNKIYVHQPVISNKLAEHSIYYPYIKEADRHISFFPSSSYPQEIICMSSYEFKSQDFILDRTVYIDDSLTIVDPRRKLIKLLNSTIQYYFSQRGLKRYNQANTDVFFQSHSNYNNKRVSLKEFGKTNVSITGRYKENFWCFGLSAYANLHPYPFFKINTHIIFENEDSSLPDTELQHVLRQGLGSAWYNKKWLDTLLGFMTRLSGYSSDGLVKIPISETDHLILSTSPMSFDTEFGYFEPNSYEDE